MNPRLAGVLLVSRPDQIDELAEIHDARSEWAARRLAGVPCEIDPGHIARLRELARQIAASGDAEAAWDFKERQAEHELVQARFQSELDRLNHQVAGEGVAERLRGEDEVNHYLAELYLMRRDARTRA